MTTAEQDAFYVEKFTRDPEWSPREPNRNERARWAKVESLLVRARLGASPRLLDVGCGRGWLTALLARHGAAEGLEPVAGVVDYARRLYPGLSFHAGTLPARIAAPGFTTYDAAVCSEVIEHVAGAAGKREFARALHDAVRPGGAVIVTTERRELLEAWRWLRRLLPPKWRFEPDQPVEEPLTESELESLFIAAGLHPEAHDRAYVRFRALSPANLLLGFRFVERLLHLPALEAVERFCHYRWALYQTWLFRRP